MHQCFPRSPATILKTLPHQCQLLKLRSQYPLSLGFRTLPPNSSSLPLGYLLKSSHPSPPSFFILRLLKFSLSWVSFICTQCSEAKKAFKINIQSRRDQVFSCLSNSFWAYQMLRPSQYCGQNWLRGNTSIDKSITEGKL